MERLEQRFLIYKGFENEAPLIFIELINKFNFRIVNVSNYGIHFTNTRCNLDITYESGLQLWLKIPKHNVSEMIPKLSMFKGDNVFNEYRKITNAKDIKEELIGISNFLVTYFFEELKDF